MPNYYVRPDGNNSSSGLTHDLAWATADKVRSTIFSTGDCVYFICDATFYPSNYININWAGTSANRAVVGAYYVDGGSEVHGVSGGKPIISGQDYHVPSNTYYGLSNQWKGLVAINNRDYITVENIKFLKSGFYGVSVEGDLDAGTNSAYFIIKEVDVEGSYNSAIVCSGNAYNYGLIENCTATQAGWGYVYGDSRTFPGTIVFSRSPYAYGTIKKCYVYNTWAEGIGVYRIGTSALNLNSGYVIVEDNIVWNTMSAGIYIGATDGCTVRRNMVLGSNETSMGGGWWNGGYGRNTFDGRVWSGGGISVWIELRFTGTPLFKNNYIYNNFIAGCMKGLGVGISADGMTGTLENIGFYNNTVVGNYWNVEFGAKINDYTVSGVDFKNNIIWVPSDCLGSQIRADRSWHPSKINFSNNAWGSTPTYSTGTNDIVFDGNLAKTTNWQELTSVISSNNFKILSSSNARGSALDMSS